MTLNTRTESENLDHLADEYLRWYIRLTNYIIYPEAGMERPGAPSGFEVWLTQAVQNYPEKKDVLMTLNRIHQDLTHEIHNILKTVEQGEGSKPKHDEFEKLSMFIEEFSNHIKRLAKAFEQSNSVMDPDTGFRSREIFLHDTAIELERLKRQGKEFCVTIARLDILDAQKEDAKIKTPSKVVNVWKEIVDRNLRSFDDTYMLDDDLFLISLKQTKLGGALNAMVRIQKNVDEKKINHPETGEPLKILISSSVMEPIVANNPQDILNALKDDIEKIKNLEGRMSRLKEETPLDKYIRATQVA